MAATATIWLGLYQIKLLPGFKFKLPKFCEEASKWENYYYNWLEKYTREQNIIIMQATTMQSQTHTNTHKKEEEKCEER